MSDDTYDGVSSQEEADALNDLLGRKRTLFTPNYDDHDINHPYRNGPAGPTLSKSIDSVRKRSDVEEP